MTKKRLGDWGQQTSPLQGGGGEKEKQEGREMEGGGNGKDSSWEIADFALINFAWGHWEQDWSG